MMRPDRSGYWAAIIDGGKLKVFEIAEMDIIRAYHCNWIPLSDIEKSFKIKQWLGMVTEDLFYGRK